MRVLALLAFAPIAVPQMVSGQTDEIQVYDGRLAAKGRFNLTLHNNFIPEGLRTPAFAGALLADRSLNGVPEWAYGVNFEFSYNARHWDPKRFTSEVRPIIGWHLHPVDIIVNPIFDTAYDGLENLDFAPATRVACELSRTWRLAIEEYDDFGPLHQFSAGNQQAHQLYGVVDHTTKSLEIEAGAGIGLTDASDRMTLKLILSRDLN